MARNFYIDSQPPGSQLRINYAAELNPQQCQAVMATAGPALVIAGAGSGKTRTLVYRVAFLIEQGIAPDRILLLTFTNKAAHEMMRRASDLLGMETRGLCGGTFHSIGARMLRQNAAKAGLQPDFTILDREDSRDMIKAVLGARKEDDRQSMFPKPDALLDLFSLAVNKHPTLREAIDREYPQFLHIADEISSVHKAFTERKRAANVVDFDDLLSAWLHLLETQTDVRDRYQDQFLYILVDEYQDTNTVQGRIVDLLAARRKNLMVVGDDSQSIYSWRGANSRNLLDFPSRYPGASIYKIETNYRSTPEILNLANAIFASTPQPFAKKLNSSRPSGMRPAVAEAEDCLMQAAFVGMRVLQLREEGVSLNQIAVLYRSHFHTLDLQLELTRRGIPFTITSGLRFFEQAHVKDVCAFLRLMANPRDELSFKRLATMLPGIGPKAADKLWAATTEHLNIQEQEGAASSQTEKPAPRIASAMQAASKLVGKKSLVPWTTLVTVVAQIEWMKKQPSEMIHLTVASFYEDYLKTTYDNVASRKEDLESLESFAMGYSDLTELLTELSLLTSAESDGRAGKGNHDEDRIRLTTIHQAKGLEYDVVFVIMLSEGLFPSARSLDSEDALEEERRLFYVAATRARNELYLCHPISRYVQGFGEQHQEPSRFLTDLPQDLCEEWVLHNRSPGGTPWDE